MNAIEHAKHLLRKLEVRHQCFDLLCEFFDRAKKEHDLTRMRSIHGAMNRIFGSLPR